MLSQELKMSQKHIPHKTLRQQIPGERKQGRPKINNMAENCGNSAKRDGCYMSKAQNVGKKEGDR